ncbi:signal peptidase I [Staphylococcus canis]|uniref:Signal peptidase I n=1 Tax=Staphylococcus canis TaxID=2724942 RepID=A0ABS0T996_9STAP|nr:signal peptidase I [Staphylococcus canis]MBI5975301.1 signal peptidase I [Staphylococcus canis]
MPKVVQSIFAFVLAVLVLGLLVAFVIIPYKVDGTNMAPALSQDDRLLINKIKPRLNLLNHGDIIVFRHQDQYHIGRIIGQQGQSVVFKNGQLELDYQPVEEPYLKQKSNETWSARTLPNAQSDIIPPHTYLVMNDQRHNRYDSRQYGLVDKKDVIGNVMIRYYPFEHITVNF